jgi:hypothetical protein
MAGNQPRMQALAYNSESGRLESQFLDATNLPSPDAGHMHDARIRIVDNWPGGKSLSPSLASGWRP